MAKRKLDLIVWGATGFTGQLVVEYLVQTYGVDSELHWAIAGRNKQKLEEVRALFLGKADYKKLPIIIANSDDADSLATLVTQTNVLCTTVGPYAKYGTPLVQACAEAGTDYCDLTGEVQWMAQIIPEYQATAQASGARIVHTCGFDSIPFDMGNWYLQQAMLERHGVAASHVKTRVGRNKGAASGGTIASMLHLLEEAKKDPSIRRIVADPYALYPPGTPAGTDGPDQQGPRFDADFHQWTSPFIMALVNTRVVRRSNALLGFPWGEDFRYDEAVLNRSRFEATRNSLAMGAGMAALAIGPTRKLAQRLLPKPGEGPTLKQRQAGFYELFFHGIHPQDRTKDMVAKVTGDMDPGYGSTSKMLGEAAVCLAKDNLPAKGGICTPASALNAKLLERLVSNAGLTFEIIDPAPF
ncbi:MAG: saccharopine dehydrogenase NADP-binding domain-containing protein [Halioglobus sp.]